MAGATISILFTAIALTLSPGPNGRSGQASCTALVRQLKTAPSERERERAAEALGSVQSDAECAVPALVEAIEDDPSYIVPYTALHALQQLGPRAISAVDRLVHLKRADPKLEYPMDPFLVADTLAKLGPHAVPRLIFHLRMSAPSADDDTYGTAGAAEAALSRLGKIAVPDLVKVLSDPKRSNAAVNVLVSIGPDASEAVPPLVDLYRSGTADSSMAGRHSYAVLRAFEAMKGKACGARDLVERLARSPETDPQTRALAKAIVQNLEHCPPSASSGTRR